MSRLRWAPRPAVVVGKWFWLSRCYVSCNGYAASRSWTSLGKPTGTAVVIPRRHNLRSAPGDSGCSTFASPVFWQCLLHMQTARPCWANLTFGFYRWITTCVLCVCGRYRSSLCQNSCGIFSKVWDFPLSVKYKLWGDKCHPFLEMCVCGWNDISIEKYPENFSISLSFKMCILQMSITFSVFFCCLSFHWQRIKLCLLLANYVETASAVYRCWLSIPVQSLVSLLQKHSHGRDYFTTSKS